MKNLFISLLILISVLTSNVRAETYGNVYANFIRTVDGDTIVVNIPCFPPIIGDNIKIRFRGIDTPELRSSDPSQKYRAYQAKELVDSILKHTTIIELRNIERGSFFRVVADVYVDGININSYIIKANLLK